MVLLTSIPRLGQVHIDVYIETACIDQLAKASDAQAVGHGFEPCPDL